MFFGTHVQQRHPGWENWVTALTKSWQDNEKTKVEKHWNVIYVIYGAYYSSFRPPSGKGRTGGVRSLWWGKKKALEWLWFSVLPCLSLRLWLFPLCLSSSLSFWLNMFCWDASSHHPPISSSSFHPAAFPSCFPQYFTALWASFFFLRFLDIWQLSGTLFSLFFVCVFEPQSLSHLTVTHVEAADEHKCIFKYKFCHMEGRLCSSKKVFLRNSLINHGWFMW